MHYPPQSGECTPQLKNITTLINVQSGFEWFELFGLFRLFQLYTLGFGCFTLFHFFVCVVESCSGCLNCSNSYFDLCVFFVSVLL